MKIKYDRRVMRIILITAVVVSVPTLAGMICGVFFDDIVSTFCDGWFVACLHGRMAVSERTGQGRI